MDWLCSSARSPTGCGGEETGHCFLLQFVVRIPMRNHPQQHFMPLHLNIVTNGLLNILAHSRRKHKPMFELLSRTAKWDCDLLSDCFKLFGVISMQLSHSCAVPRCHQHRSKVSISHAYTFLHLNSQREMAFLLGPLIRCLTQVLAAPAD